MRRAAVGAAAALALAWLAWSALAQQEGGCTPWPGPEQACCREVTEGRSCFVVCGCQQAPLQDDPCLRTPEACADDPCEENPLLCAPECRADTDCGREACTEIGTACGEAGVRVLLQCSQPQCQDNRCTTVTRFRETVRACSGRPACEGWTYFCSGQVLQRKRACSAESCQERDGSAACVAEGFSEEETVAVCEKGCVKGACVGAAAPLARAFARPRSGLVPLIAKFTAADPVEGATYVWDFGDGSPPATGAAVFHRFEAPGAYTVKLTVFGPGGGKGTDTVTVRALAEEERVELEGVRVSDFYDPGDQVTVEVACRPQTARQQVMLRFRNDSGQPVPFLGDAVVPCGERRTFGPGRGGLATTRKLYTVTAQLPPESGCSRCVARATFSLVDPAPESAPIETYAFWAAGGAVLVLAVIVWRL